jgi:hypothetical protein
MLSVLEWSEATREARGGFGVTDLEAWLAAIGRAAGTGRGCQRALLESKEAEVPVGRDRVFANSLAVSGESGSLTPMAHYQRTQPPEGSPPAGPALDAASIEAVARRVVELIHDEGGSPTGRQLVDAATLAAELGVDRSWVYSHSGELGAVKLGTGSKPRLRFDREVALEVFAGYATQQPQHPGTSSGAEWAAPPGRHRRRSPNGRPAPGSVLAVRPRKRT